MPKFFIRWIRNLVSYFIESFYFFCQITCTVKKFLGFKQAYPANICFFKVSIETLGKGMKYVESYQSYQ